MTGWKFPITFNKYSRSVETVTDVKRGVNYAFGNDMSHNNLQPYITTYMWKRTS